MNKTHWSPEDQMQAQQEGWGIFDIDHSGVLRIERYGEDNDHQRFPSDGEAERFVIARAKEGSAFHERACAHVSASDDNMSFEQFTGIMKARMTKCIDEALADYPDGKPEGMVFCYIVRTPDGVAHRTTAAFGEMDRAFNSLARAMSARRLGIEEPGTSNYRGDSGASYGSMGRATGA